MPNQGAAYRSVPLMYRWGDHDYCGDATDGTAVGKANALEAFEDVFARHALVDPTQGTYRTFDIGRVRFLVLDERYNRSVNNATDDASKTMLRATQKTWFKSQITAAKVEYDAGTLALVVVVGSVPWTGAAGSLTDTWSNFTTERAGAGRAHRDRRHDRAPVLAAWRHAWTRL